MTVDEALALEAATTWPPGCEQDEAVHVLAAEVRRLRTERYQMGTLPFEVSFLVHGEPEQLIFRGPNGQVVLRRLREDPADG